MQRHLKNFYTKLVKKIGKMSQLILQFMLNKNNDEIFMDTFVRSRVETEAEYWRNIIFTYINNLRYRREEILFEKIFRKIKEGMQGKRKVKIKYHKYIRLVNPYFVKVADDENRSYLFC